MFGISRNFTQLFTTSKNGRLPWYKLILIIVLTLGVSGGTQATQAQAAPIAQSGEQRFRIAAVVPPGKFCAGQDYEISVKVLANTTGVFPVGSGSGHYARALPGESVDAYVQNESIGTISPNKQITGFVWSGASADNEYGNPNEAIFTFHAKKAGKTDLWFAALVKALKEENPSTYGYVDTPFIPIDVVNCEYDVKLTYLGQTSILGTEIIGRVPKTRLKWNGSEFRAVAPMLVNYTTYWPPCAAYYDPFSSDTTIIGHWEEKPGSKQLVLNFNYAPGTLHFTAGYCQGIVVGGDQAWDFNAHGFTTATFPETGGTKSFPAYIGAVTVEVVRVTSSDQ